MPTREPEQETTGSAGADNDLGARLRHAREAQGLAIDDLATELRIGAGSLAALEDCRFDALGAPVFAKGYLKQYGTRLGLDVGELLRNFDTAAGASKFEMAPLRKIRMRDERQITVWILAGLALALLFVFLAWWWLGRGNALPDFVGLFSRGDNAAVAASADAVPVDETREPERPAPPAARSGSAEATATTAPAAAAAVAPTGRDTVAPAAEEPPAVAEPVAAVTPAATVAGTTLDGTTVDGTTVAGTTENPPASASAPDSTPDSGSEPAAITGPALEVVFVEDSWAEIVDEDGNRLFYNLGRAGTRARFPADRNLNLLFGNARGIELSLDGEPLTIPGARRSGQVVAIDLAALIE